MSSTVKIRLLKFTVLTISFLMITGCTSIKQPVSLEHNIESIQILTGAVNVEGKGICITLTDNKSKTSSSNNIIHDVDLVEIVNLLTTAGAEVISINDERLISTSKIKASKMMIQINNNEYNGPFIIKAIGDSELLINELEKEESYINLLKEYIIIKIEKNDNIFIPKYTGNIDFNYAKPVKKI